jgi:hypothetical protein
MRDRLGMNEPMLEPALNGHRFGLGDQVSALAATTRVHEGAPTIVLNDELVAEDLGDLTLHRHFAPVVHGRDRCGREHYQSRAPGLQSHGRHTTAEGESHQKRSEEGRRSLSRLKVPEPWLWFGRRQAAGGRLGGRHLDKTSLLNEIPVYAHVPQHSLNLSVQVQLSRRH